MRSWRGFRLVFGRGWGIHRGGGGGGGGGEGAGALPEMELGVSRDLVRTGKMG